MKGLGALMPITTKRGAEFIVFAVQQARAAQAFGFTRNECCRNLKTTLHQYWQHKAMGLHSQARKKDIPRSVAALGLHLSECVVEHAVPQMVIVNWLMDMEPLTEGAVVRMLKKYFRVMLVTSEEHARLNASGVRSTMPPDWKRANVFARYEMVGIVPAANSSRA